MVANPAENGVAVDSPENALETELDLSGGRDDVDPSSESDNGDAANGSLRVDPGTALESPMEQSYLVKRMSTAGSAGHCSQR